MACGTDRSSPRCYRRRRVRRGVASAIALELTADLVVNPLRFRTRQGRIRITRRRFEIKRDSSVSDLSPIPFSPLIHPLSHKPRVVLLRPSRRIISGEHVHQGERLFGLLARLPPSLHYVVDGIFPSPFHFYSDSPVLRRDPGEIHAVGWSCGPLAFQTGRESFVNAGANYVGKSHSASRLPIGQRIQREPKCISQGHDRTDYCSDDPLGTLR